MFRTRGNPKEFSDYYRMNLRETEGWYEFKNGAFYFNLIMLGNEASGPVISLLNAAPNTILPPSPAHGHASDSFRIAIKGQIHMEPDVYGPGEFRFQQGWRVYPGHETVTYDAEGQWEVVILGDNRGQKMRPAVEIDPNPENEMLKSIAADFDMIGDVMSNDPTDGAGPSAIATTLASKVRMGKLNGSFLQSSAWPQVAPGVNAIIALLGDCESGPVIVCSQTAPNQIAMAAAQFGTEVARIVIAGSFRIGSDVYRQGDVRIQKAGAGCDELVALEEGVQEVIVFGDRRHLDIVTQSEWPAALEQEVRTLREDLTPREEALRSPV